MEQTTFSKPLAKVAKRHPNDGKPAELSERDEKVAYFILRGHNYREVAQMIGVKSTQTVWASVQRCIAYWRQETLKHIDQWLGIEIHKTMRIEAEAWAAWERSRLPAETQRIVQAALPPEDNGNEATTFVPVEVQSTQKGQAGDPRYLVVIDKCIDRRCKLLGLYAPERLALTDPTGTKEYGADARDTLLSRLLQGTVAIRAEGTAD